MLFDQIGSSDVETYEFIYDKLFLQYLYAYYFTTRSRPPIDIYLLFNTLATSASTSARSRSPSVAHPLPMGCSRSRGRIVLYSILPPT